MKRNSFLQMLAAPIALLVTPVWAHARAWIGSREAKGFRVEAGKDRSGKSISLFEGDTFYTKVSTHDTDGDIFVFESTRLKEGGPPLHIHYEQDEWWYILQGEFLFQVGDETFRAKAGDSVFGPRRVPHAFAKVGAGEARILMFFQPAGKMEAHFLAVSEGVTANMAEAERQTFRKEHGFEAVGPPLTHLKQ
jgi:mannose-6-phosphate isomerase-like protein (cupin superfamily)